MSSHRQPCCLRFTFLCPSPAAVGLQSQCGPPKQLPPLSNLLVTNVVSLPRHLTVPLDPYHPGTSPSSTQFSLDSQETVQIFLLSFWLLLLSPSWVSLPSLDPSLGMFLGPLSLSILSSPSVSLLQVITSLPIQESMTIKAGPSNLICLIANQISFLKYPTGSSGWNLSSSLPAFLLTALLR